MRARRAAVEDAQTLDRGGRADAFAEVHRGIQPDPLLGLLRAETDARDRDRERAQLRASRLVQSEPQAAGQDEVESWRHLQDQLGELPAEQRSGNGRGRTDLGAAVDQQVPESGLRRVVLEHAFRIRLGTDAEPGDADPEDRIGRQDDELVLPWGLAIAWRLTPAIAPMKPIDSGKSRVGSFVSAKVEVGDLVVEIGQLDRELDESLQKCVLLECEAERPNGEVLRRHVRREIEDGRRLAGHTAPADEPLLQVEARRKPLHERVEVEDLHATQVDALPVWVEVECLRVDTLRKGLIVRKPQDEVLRADDDTRRADLAVRQVEVAGRLHADAGVGVDGDCSTEVELRGGPRRVDLETLGQIARVLRTHRPQVVRVEAKADVDLGEDELVRAVAPFEELVERLLGQPAGDFAGRQTEVELERQCRQVRPGLTEDELHAVHQRQVEGQFVPQRERPDDAEFALVFDQLEPGDAGVLAESTEHGHVARGQQVMRPIGKKIESGDEVRRVHGHIVDPRLGAPRVCCQRG